MKTFLKSALFCYVLTAFFCSPERTNPLDEKGANYTPPEIIFESEAGYITDGDTVQGGRVFIRVRGNQSHSMFQAAIDSEEWSEWSDEGVFFFDSLETGFHVISIRSKYDGGTKVIEDEIRFFVLPEGGAPFYTATTDTIIRCDAGQALTLRAPAAGKEPLTYTWLRGSAKLTEPQVTDTLVIASVQAKDTGSYFCIVENEKGKDTSRAFILLIATITTPAYTITYDANGAGGGAVPTDAEEYKAGDIVIIKENEGDLQKADHAFVGWNTAMGGTGEKYAPGAQYTMGDEDVVFYAQWSADPAFRVIYQGNGNTSGTPPIDNNSYEKGMIATVKGNTNNLDKEGYAFVGWNTVADGGGQDYAGGGELPIGEQDITLYAQWTQNPTYTVIYDANGSEGGIVPVDNNKYEEGAIVTVRGNTGNLERMRYYFVHWNAQPDGSGESYAGGEEFAMGNTDDTLYAQWASKPTYSVTYSGNGNTGGNPPVDNYGYVKGEEVTILGNTGGLARMHYSFTGWSMNAAGDGAGFKPGDTFTMDSNDTTLYAKWRLKPVSISKQPVDKTVYPGCSVVLSVEVVGEFPRYQWQKDGRDIDGADRRTYTVRNVAVSGHTFRCIVRNASGADTSVSVTITIVEPHGMKLVEARGKSFQMGGNDGDNDEKPVHTVSFTSSFYIDTTEITQKRYAEIMSSAYGAFQAPAWNSAKGMGDNYPAYLVNWFDAALFCNARTKQMGGIDTIYRYSSIKGTPGNDCELEGLAIDLSKTGFRLATEAEWEYACRGATTTDWYWGASAAEDYAWYSGAKAEPVARNLPNGYGLYDMSGNVSEWCNDWYGSDYYSSSPASDPPGPDGQYRVIRGGSWNFGKSQLRSADRYFYTPSNNYVDVGFRTVYSQH